MNNNYVINLAFVDTILDIMFGPNAVYWNNQTILNDIYNDACELVSDVERYILEMKSETKSEFNIFEFIKLPNIHKTIIIMTFYQLYARKPYQKIIREALAMAINNCFYSDPGIIPTKYNLKPITSDTTQNKFNTCCPVDKGFYFNMDDNSVDMLPTSNNYTINITFINVFLDEWMLDISRYINHQVIYNQLCMDIHRLVAYVEQCMRFNWKDKYDVTLFINSGLITYEWFRNIYKLKRFDIDRGDAKYFYYLLAFSVYNCFHDKTHITIKEYDE